jgi:hypothetical protein
MEGEAAIGAEHIQCMGGDKGAVCFRLYLNQGTVYNSEAAG